MLAREVFFVFVFAEAVDLKPTVSGVSLGGFHELIPVGLEGCHQRKLLAKDLADEHGDATQGAEQGQAQVEVEAIEAREFVGHMAFLKFFEIWHILILPPADKASSTCLYGNITAGGLITHGRRRKPCYVFDIRNGNQLARLHSGAFNQDVLGAAVAILGRTVLVGGQDSKGVASAFLYQLDYLEDEAATVRIDISSSRYEVLENEREVKPIGDLRVLGWRGDEAHLDLQVEAPFELKKAAEGWQLLALAPLDHEAKNSIELRVDIYNQMELLNSRLIQIEVKDDRQEDADGDGLTEQVEEDVYGTSDVIADSDGDGWNDGDEVALGHDPMSTLLLRPPHKGSTGDGYGNAVSISGGAAIVGAIFDSQSLARQGAAYVFDRISGTLSRRIEARQGQAQDFFGNSVAVDGAYLVAGAQGVDTNGSLSGGAYVVDLAVARETFLVPSDGAASDLFGQVVAIDDGVALVGAHRADPKGESSGAVYVFDAASGEELSKLIAEDGAEGDFFGWSAAIDDSAILVGAWQDDDQGESSGSVYVYDQEKGEQRWKWVPSDGRVGRAFGKSLALDGRRAVIGAPGGDGVIYVFDVETGEEQLALSNPGNVDGFGSSVGVSGRFGVIGSWDGTAKAGQVFVIDLDLGMVVTELEGLDTKHVLGKSVAIEGASVVVGGEDEEGAGVSYLYALDQLLDWKAGQDWSSDEDGDGLPTGVEWAIGTDPLIPSPDAGPKPIAEGLGVSFGYDPSAAERLLWVVSRSYDLETYGEIFRFDGDTASVVKGVEANVEDKMIIIRDRGEREGTRFYRLEAHQR